MIDTKKLTRLDILSDIRDILEKDCAASELLPDDHSADIFHKAVATLEGLHMLEDRAFHNYVQMFIRSRKLPGVSFHMEDGGDFRNYWRGFSVRERGGVLYVTEALPESGLKRGDRIVGLNREDPATFYNLSCMRPKESHLSGDEDWQALLNQAMFASVLRANAESPEKLRLMEIPLSVREPWTGHIRPARDEALTPELKCLPGGALYLKLPVFPETEKMEALVRGWSAVRGDAAILVLDLRGCRGGDAENLQPLLPYLCDESMSRDTFFGEVRERTRYTERNCELFREQMRPFLSGSDNDLKELAGERLAEIERCRGRDYAETAAELLEPGGWIPEPDSPFENVRILVDESTEGEAEWLATRAKRQKKVTVFGRKSSGEMDYGSPVTMHYAYGAMLRYSASRLVFGSDEEAESARVIPDEEIPWTPEELYRDVILEAALR